jgi:hypothetical protein
VTGGNVRQMFRATVWTANRYGDEHFGLMPILLVQCVTNQSENTAIINPEESKIIPFTVRGID